MISFGLDRLIQQIKTKPASMSDKDVVEDVETLEEVRLTVSTISPSGLGEGER
jgi:hypothetical protein